MSVAIESPYATSYFLLTLTDVLSRIVFEVIPDYCSNFGHFAFLSPPLEAWGNIHSLSYAHWKACSRLPVSVN